MLQLLANERKARMEADELRNQLRKVHEEKKVEKKRAGTDEETARKLRKMEDVVQELQGKLALQKQVCWLSVVRLLV